MGTNEEGRERGAYETMSEQRPHFRTSPESALGDGQALRYQLRNLAIEVGKGCITDALLWKDVRSITAGKGRRIKCTWFRPDCTQQCVHVHSKQEQSVDFIVSFIGSKFLSAYLESCKHVRVAKTGEAPPKYWIRKIRFPMGHHLSTVQPENKIF